jgi:LacI family transcriptional regulator
MKVLLRETDLPIQDIADRSGYEYAEYMAATFKRATGLTPSEFRQSSRQLSP